MLLLPKELVRNQYEQELRHEKFFRTFLSPVTGGDWPLGSTLPTGDEVHLMAGVEGGECRYYDTVKGCGGHIGGAAGRFHAIFKV